MIFLLPFHGGDVMQAERWLGWVYELGGCRGHSIVLMPAKELPEIDALRESAGRSFDHVDVLRDAEGINGHPEGPNAMMRQAVWHMQTSNLGPWTNIEPDCIPRESGWADQWQREYIAFGKPFMGELRPAHDVVPDYLTGNMVLPKDALLQAPMLGRRGLSKDGIELAFDIVAAAQTLPKAHLTKLLQQVPKNPDGSSHTFPDQTSLSLLRPGAIFFHPCKDGTLIDRLREQKTQVRQFVNDVQDGNMPAPVVVHHPDVRTQRRVEAINLVAPRMFDAEANKRIAELLARIAELEAELASRVRIGVMSDLEPRPRRRLKSKPKAKPKCTAAEQAKINARMATLRALKKTKLQPA